MPERMVKVSIVAPKSYQGDIIEELFSLKMLHIEEHLRGELDIGSPQKGSDVISELLVKARSTASHLGIKLTFVPSKRHSLDEIEKKVLQIHALVSGLLEQKKAFEERKKSLLDLISQLEQLSAIPLMLDDYHSYSSLAVYVGFVRDKSLRSHLRKITEQAQLYHAHGSDLIALFVDIEQKQKVDELLSNVGFVPFNFPKDSGDPRQRLKQSGEELSRAEKSIADISSQLLAAKNKYINSLCICEHFLSEQFEKSQVPLRFGATENIFTATGYAPEESYGMLRQRLERITDGKIYVRKEEPDHEDKVPTKLHNPGVARSFESLIRLRGLPYYDEIDPTLLVFLSFPLFFGFMLGDIGYGLVTLALVLAIRAKFKSGFLDVIAISAFISIIFGFIYGEFFGFEELFGFHIPHVISRAHEFQELLVYSLAFGVLHLNLGLVLGFINEYRHHGLRSAILEKGSWFLIELGGPFILGMLNVVKLPQTLMIASGGIMLVGIIMLAIGELKIGSIGAFKAIVESITIFSNILSYARLMAVGLASVQLALIVNTFAEEAFHQGGFSIVAGILILLVGHTINLVLGVLGSFLHSLRLEYVEFFTKFFNGGARPFRAFGEKN